MERGDAPRPPRRRIGHDERGGRRAERRDRYHGAPRLSPRGGRAHEADRDVAVPRRVGPRWYRPTGSIRWWRRRACCSTRAGGSKSSGLVGTRAPGICCRWDCSTRTATASTRWSRAGSSGRPSTDVAPAPAAADQLASCRRIPAQSAPSSTMVDPASCARRCAPATGAGAGSSGGSGRPRSRRARECPRRARWRRGAPPCPRRSRRRGRDSRWPGRSRPTESGDSGPDRVMPGASLDTARAPLSYSTPTRDTQHLTQRPTR